jgi:hypothetical protein
MMTAYCLPPNPIAPPSVANRALARDIVKKIHSVQLHSVHNPATWLTYAEIEIARHLDAAAARGRSD